MDHGVGAAELDPGEVRGEPLRLPEARDTAKIPARDLGGLIYDLKFVGAKSVPRPIVLDGSNNTKLRKGTIDTLSPEEIERSERVRKKPPR